MRSYGPLSEINVPSDFLFEWLYFFIINFMKFIVVCCCAMLNVQQNMTLFSVHVVCVPCPLRFEFWTLVVMWLDRWTWMQCTATLWVASINQCIFLPTIQIKKTFGSTSELLIEENKRYIILWLVPLSESFIWIPKR